MKEFIVCAANKYGDLILCGARHWDGLMHNQVDILGVEKFRKLRSEHGEQQCFVNSRGEFRTRKEAMIIVKENGQPFDQARNGGSDVTLFSEGLY
jgi:hypothetical protein